VIKNLIIPNIPLARVPVMIGYGVIGGLLAGFYGIIHDQLTYSISTEYFTRLKFSQFHYANFGLPHRVFVAEIGFLATWWVGFVAAWFLARVTVPSLPRATALRYSLRGYMIIFAGAFLGSIAGYLLGILHSHDYSDWEGFRYTFGVVDLPSFVRVAYIHNASYLGGLIGLIAAVIYTRKRTNNDNTRLQPGAPVKTCQSGFPGPAAGPMNS
jgi:hypothetical protein